MIITSSTIVTLTIRASYVISVRPYSYHDRLIGIKNPANVFDPNKINKDDLRSKGIALASNLSFIRADLPMKNKLPADLLKVIFSSELNNTTNVINVDNKAYWAYLKKVNSSKMMADKIRKNAGDHFSNVIKEGVFQDLIAHLTRKNNMKIKTNFAKIG